MTTYGRGSEPCCRSDGRAIASTRAETDFRPGRVDRHSGCAAQRHLVEDVAEGGGMRVRHHVLAASGKVATSGSLEAAPSPVADRVTAPWPGRSGPRRGRQFVAPRCAGEKTEPNPRAAVRVG